LGILDPNALAGVADIDEARELVFDAEFSAG
jgi:hypothetical protein